MFSLKGLLPDRKRTVGLDVGSSSIKLVEILDASEGYLLNNFSQVPLEKGIIVEGSIVNANALSERIRGLFKISGCNTKRVVTSLSGHKVISKKATFPTLEADELRQLINDEAGNYLPFDDVKDVSFDFRSSVRAKEIQGRWMWCLSRPRRILFRITWTPFKRPG
jgi:type IV pilus assembly protein PilM